MKFNRVIILVVGVIFVHSASAQLTCNQEMEPVSEKETWRTMVDPCLKKMQDQVQVELSAALTYMAMISAALCKLMINPDIAKIIHWTLSEIASEEIKLMVTINVLKDLQDRCMPNTLRTAVISEISLATGKNSPKELVVLTNFCIEAIQQNKDEHKSWKDLLPKLLNVVVEKEEVLLSGTPMSGEEYKINVIQTLCMANWDSKSLAALASMFIDVPMKLEEHTQVVIKLCNAIPDLGTDELPPLVHELLRLCKDKNCFILFLQLQEYFKNLIYNVPAMEALDSYDIITNSSREITQAQHAESTILLYINQSAQVGHSSIKDLIKSVKNLKFCTEKVFEPFLVTVLLSITNITEFETQVLDLLKQIIVTMVTEEDKRVKSAWIRSHTPEDCKIDSTIIKITKDSVRVRESVIKGLMSLGFVLLNTPISPKIKEPVAEKLCLLGTQILVRLVKKQSEELGSLVLNRIYLSIKRKEAVKQHIYCLHHVSMAVPIMISQNHTIVTGLMERLVHMEEDTGLDLVRALLPGIRSCPHLKDTIIVILRKALFSSAVDTRLVAASSFLLLLKHFKMKSMGVLSQSSQASSRTSSQVNNSRILFTEAVCEYDNPRTTNLSNNAICLELLGVLRRCLMQQFEIKRALFKGLSSSVCENPELLSYVEDILVNYLKPFFLETEAVLPPLDFAKVAVVKDLAVVPQEPLAHLIFVCQQVVVQDNSLSPSGVKLQEILDSLTDRMTKCTLEEFKLTDAAELLDNLPENHLKQEMVKQALGVYEALMSYILASWARDSSNHGKKLVGLFKGYNRLAEFCKSTCKIKKSDGNEGGDSRRTKNMKSQGETTTTTKKKGATGKCITFKFPPSLWDFPTTLKMLKLIYEDSVEWSTEEMANQTKNHRELRRYAIQVASQLVKHSSMVREKSSEMFGFYIQLGRLLYQRVICRLEEEIEYDHSSSIVAVECFYDLLVFVGANYRARLGQFFDEIGDARTKGSEVQLMKIITTHQQVLKDMLAQDEDKDEPGSKKVPQLLVLGLSFLVSHLSSTGSNIENVYEWVKELAVDTTVSNDHVAQGILDLLLNLHMRCKTSGSLFDSVALQLRSIIGTHTHFQGDSTNDKFTKLAIVTTSTRNYTLSTLCSGLTNTLQEVQWMVSRFLSEYTSYLYVGQANHQQCREMLKGKERNLCCHMSYTINVIIYLTSLDLQNMPTPLMTVVRLLINLYLNVTNLTRYFFARSSKLNPAFQAARFESLVKLCGKELSNSVNGFIMHIENCTLGDKKSKKKETDASILRLRVLREEKIIPKVIFEKEEFEKWLIKLSKKTKIDLMEHVKVNGARDFRIKRGKLTSGVTYNNSTLETTTAPGNGINGKSSGEESADDEDQSNRRRGSRNKEFDDEHLPNQSRLSRNKDSDDEHLPNQSMRSRNKESGKDDDQSMQKRRSRNKSSGEDNQHMQKRRSRNNSSGEDDDQPKQKRCSRNNSSGEDDDQPKQKRRSRNNDPKEDDQPKQKRRSRNNSSGEDDDQPKQKRRSRNNDSEEDDQPKQKRHSTNNDSGEDDDQPKQKRRSKNNEPGGDENRLKKKRSCSYNESEEDEEQPKQRKRLSKKK